ncbi:MAG: FAD-dependent oxidoreductase [Chloroflexota bacterium]|nr:FAD-dependent oxidoreductase [Chloroflexota bacterium]
MSTEEHTQSCLVVGAGLSGLLAARTLCDRGWEVTVLDKGRGVGGRLATQRIEDGVFDHGAQFFTVRGEQFEQMVSEWWAAGIVEEWSRGFATPDGRYEPDGYPRYRGSTGMTAIAKHLARGLDVRTGQRVVEVARAGRAWRASTESGAVLSARCLILTAPVPQSLALVSAGAVGLPAEVREALERIDYQRCISVMALLDGPCRTPEPGGIQYSGQNGTGEPVWWLADNKRKGISPVPAITLHAGPQFSAERWEVADETVALELLGYVGDFVGAPVRRVQFSRWRYSMPVEPYPEPCLLASVAPPLVFAGDAFGGPKVEGAAMSGLAAAAQLIEIAEARP